MPFLLHPDIPLFPHPSQADEDGLLAVGGKITPDFLKAAYRLGIFPWYNEDMPILWWSPPQRPVFFPDEVKISKTMRQWIRRHPDYRITLNKAFDRVLYHCATVPRKSGEGTWLNEELRKNLGELHKEGLALSVEVWNGRGELAGGLYGITAGEKGNVLSGESMFSLEPNTSKFALIWLVRNLKKLGFELLDGQVVSDHLLRMGAQVMERDEFLNRYIFR